MLHAKNETVRQSHLNRELGRVYLKAADPSLATRTWQEVIDHFCDRQHLRESFRERSRRAFAGKHFDIIRNVILTETSTELLLSVLEKSGNLSTLHYLRRLHNYAFGLGWLPWQVVPPKTWPPQHAKRRRAITEAEHQRILAAESNFERRLYYDLLWLTGAIRSDNGSEFVARAPCKPGWRIARSRPLYIEPGSPWQNGHVESFHGSLRDECLDRELMLSVAEARVVIEDYRRHYNEERPHGGLGKPSSPGAANHVFSGHGHDGAGCGTPRRAAFYQRGRGMTSVTKINEHERP